MVFFDDILVYSRTWEEHLQHLDEVLSILEENFLFAKESKCEFGLNEILYLGHVIGVDGVKVHRRRSEQFWIGHHRRMYQSCRVSLVYVPIIGGLLRDFHR